MSTLSPADIKVLEQTRQRLFQLTKSLESLQDSIHKSDPLPPWPSLQSMATIISQSLLTVSQHLNNNKDVFASTVTYPLPSFPGQAEENLLGQLLRKKLEPNVEDWVQRGRDIASDVDESKRSDVGNINAVELRVLWTWAGQAANAEARKREWGDVFTLEEREAGIKNVMTGLRRKLDEDSDEDSDEEVEGTEEKEDVVMQDAGTVSVRRKSGQAGIELQIKPDDGPNAKEPSAPSLHMDDVLRFMTIGAEPHERKVTPANISHGIGVRR
ncbi:MAG: mediator of RNA polymerase II transcription subunit 8 [Piccolia ochrophora]|nr:MAG: mediator of RNA polymerase II transcription subunit 8 [Piccolia ochrophora]